ncbi:hypothetical protein WJX72_009753 [[Myrmecia] bisecta]|uniref:Uncharacterized protein n=1 Tax=[Myrmecia] bisecta TaxID=41462 RepID=A0AAW1R8X5_9CHLO
MCAVLENVTGEAGSAVARLKNQGDAEYKQGHLEAACSCYSEALALSPRHVSLLCNRSLVQFALGEHQAALADASAAVQLLERQRPRNVLQLSKAWFRKGACFQAMGDSVEAIQAFRQSLSGKKTDPALHQAIGEASQQLPVPWMAGHWAALITDAQAPNPLSSRDGKLLKPIALEQRLTLAELADRLAIMLEYKLARESREMLARLWINGAEAGKAELALMRAYAYLQTGQPAQALKDSKVALTYGPQADGQCCLARAHAAQSAAYEGLQDNVPAALAMQIALELEPGSEEYESDLERLMRRIPDPPAAALQEGGSARLLGWLAAEKERNTPEFLKQRPKYYYYFEWMKERINAHCPGLPAPVMDKLLTMDAGELDLILTHKRAIQEKATLLLGLLDGEGPKYLETYRVKPLTWQQVKELTGPGTIGLGLNGAVTSVDLLQTGMGPKPGELPAPYAEGLPALPAGEASSAWLKTVSRSRNTPQASTASLANPAVIGKCAATLVAIPEDDEDEVDLDGVD